MFTKKKTNLAGCTFESIFGSFCDPLWIVHAVCVCIHVVCDGSCCVFLFLSVRSTSWLCRLTARGWSCCVRWPGRGSMMRGRRRVLASLRTQVSGWMSWLGADVEGDVWEGFHAGRLWQSIQRNCGWEEGGRQGAITLLHTIRASFSDGGGFYST